MKHLTIDEIIDFVMVDSIDTDSMSLMTQVTTHIRGCESCLKKVQAYQQLHTKFSDLENRDDLRRLLENFTEDDSSANL